MLQKVDQVENLQLLNLIIMLVVYQMLLILKKSLNHYVIYSKMKYVKLVQNLGFLNTQYLDNHSLDQVQVLELSVKLLKKKLKLFKMLMQSIVKKLPMLVLIKQLVNILQLLQTCVQQELWVMKEHMIMQLLYVQ